MVLDFETIKLDEEGNVTGEWKLNTVVDTHDKPIVKIYTRNGESLVTKPLDSSKLKLFKATETPLKDCEYVVNFEIREIDENHGVLLMEYVKPCVVTKTEEGVSKKHLFWNSKLKDARGNNWGLFAKNIAEYFDENKLTCHDIRPKNSGARSNDDIALFDIDSVYPNNSRAMFDQTFMSPLDAFQSFVGKLKLKSARNEIFEKYQTALMYDKTAMACFVKDFYQYDNDPSFQGGSRALSDNLRKDLLMSNSEAKVVQVLFAIRRKYIKEKKDLTLELFYVEFLERLIYPYYEESGIPRPGPDSPTMQLIEKAKRYYKEIQIELQDSQNKDPNVLAHSPKRLKSTATRVHNNIKGTSCLEV